MKIYQVGGCVRDKLLSRTVSDRDWLVVGGSPEELIALNYKPVGKDFPVFLHPVTHEEYALARTERKAINKRGHGDFTFYYAKDVSVEDDLSRRDLTINAIAIADDGQIIDPYNGQGDINNKIIRHISPAFAEDPLRIMRVARFCAQLPDFKIANETLQLLTKMVANDELKHLSIERIWQELARGLAESEPRKMFEVLDEVGALAKILPEITALKNIPQSPESHPEKDAFEHTLLVLSSITKLTNKAHIRFAGLCHDLGKATTPKESLPHHPEHNLRGGEIVKKICQRLKTPTLYLQSAEVVCRWHGMIFTLFKDPSNINNWQDLFNGVDLWRRPAQLEDLLIVVRADYQGRLGFENSEFKFVDKVSEIAKIISAPSTGEKPTDKESRERIISQRINKVIFDKFN